MKSAFKVLGIIAIVAIIGFSMAACGDGSGGGNKILGLPYSLKFEHKDNIGGELTSYILDCSYDEALQILTKKFGVYGWQQYSAQGGNRTFPVNIPFLDYREENPDWVAFQDCVDLGDYRLVHAYTPVKGESDGRSWDKAYEQEGSIRITGMPEWSDGNSAWLRVIEYLDGVVDLKPGWENRAQHRKAFEGASKISNGSVDLSLYWFPSKKWYDRKNGTYIHGKNFTIFLYVSKGDNDVVFRIPTITFTNGHADLDFNTGKEDPSGALK